MCLPSDFLSFAPFIIWPEDEERTGFASCSALNSRVTKKNLHVLARLYCIPTKVTNTVPIHLCTLRARWMDHGTNTKNDFQNHFPRWLGIKISVLLPSPFLAA